MASQVLIMEFKVWTWLQALVEGFSLKFRL